MTSNIFNAMGIGGIDPAIFFIIFLVLFIVLLIIVIVQAVKFSNLRKTYNKFMQGKTARSMESEIVALFSDIRFLKKSVSKADDEIQTIKKNLTFAYQKLGIVRYDAFREMGGKLSFSIAMLNERNDGYIMNSVHSTDGCYTYIKEVVNGESLITLGEEEREALSRAMSSNFSNPLLSKIEKKPVDIDDTPDVDDYDEEPLIDNDENLDSYDDTDSIDDFDEFEYEE